MLHEFVWFGASLYQARFITVGSVADNVRGLRSRSASATEGAACFISGSLPDGIEFVNFQGSNSDISTLGEDR